MRLKALCLAAGLGVLLCSPLTAQIDPNPTVPDAVGLNIHFTDPKPGELKMLSATGVRWVRMDFIWDRIERQPGKYDFSVYDRLMAALQQYHLRPVFILDYTNGLYDHGASPHSPEAQTAMASWAAAAVTRFRGQGIVWEMYNEPNTSLFWHPQANAQDYINTALAVGQAIQKAAPGEAVVGPGTSGVDFPFIEACLKAGLLKYWAGVSIHPYRDSPPESASSDLGRLHRLIAQYARGKQIPIVVSEWGYPLHGSMDEATQAKFLPRAWLFARAADIPLSIWYNWLDPTSNDPKNMVKGAYNASRDQIYQPKAVFFAAQALTSFFDGYRYVKRLVMPGLTGVDDYVLLFSNGSDVRVAAWSPLPSGHRIVIPASPGKFRVVNNTGQQGPPLAADARGLSLVVSDSPQYLQSEAPNSKLRSQAGI
jgi:hypothetical protein